MAAKRAFLEVFRTIGIISPAAAAAGVARKTVYVWQEHDDQFAVAFNSAKDEAVDALEVEARRRAVEGVLQERPIFYRGELVGKYVVREYSDRLLELLLKAGRPEKYRERFDVTNHNPESLLKPLFAEDLALLLPPGEERDALLNGRERLRQEDQAQRRLRTVT